MSRVGRFKGPLKIDPMGFGVTLGRHDKPIEDFVREIAEDKALEGGTFHAEISIKLTPQLERLGEAAREEDEAWADYIAEKRAGNGQS